jgi:hypothetical protein
LGLPLEGDRDLDRRLPVGLLDHLRPLDTERRRAERRCELADLLLGQCRIRVEQVGRGLCVPVVQGVDERLGGPCRAAAAAQKQEAADGKDTDPGTAETEYLPAAQAGDDLVVLRLTVLPLLGLAVLPLLWLALTGLSTLRGCLPLWLALPGLPTLRLSALPLPGLALSGLTALRLSLAGLTLSLSLSLSRLAALGLPALRSALLWLATLWLPPLWLPALRLALLGLPALLWVAAVLVPTLRVVVLCATAVRTVALAGVLSLVACQVVAE